MRLCWLKYDCQEIRKLIFDYAFLSDGLLKLNSCVIPEAVRQRRMTNYSVFILSGSEKTPCIIIDKPLVVYRFSGTCNVMKLCP